MKRFIPILIICFFSFVACGNSESKITTKQNSLNDTYDIYIFKKEYCFKLNTVDGRIWQFNIDWDEDDETYYRFAGEQRRFLEFTVNPNPLIKDSKHIPGRFSLHETNYRDRYLLLDTISGQTWDINLRPIKGKEVVTPIHANPE